MKDFLYTPVGYFGDQDLFERLDWNEYRQICQMHDAGLMPDAWGALVPQGDDPKP